MASESGRLSGCLKTEDQLRQIVSRNSRPKKGVSVTDVVGSFGPGTLGRLLFDRLRHCDNRLSLF